MRVFGALAVATLVIDAYLLLALIATRHMKFAYLRFLPPFGSDAAATVPGYVWLILVAWTAVLAVGCLVVRRRPDRT